MVRKGEKYVLCFFCLGGGGILLKFSILRPVVSLVRCFGGENAERSRFGGIPCHRRTRRSSRASGYGDLI